MVSDEPLDYKPSLQRYRLSQYIIFARLLLGGDIAAAEKRFYEARWADLKSCGLDRSDRSLRFVDLGSGSMRPQFMLLRQEGFEVSGVDLVNKPGVSPARVVYAAARLVLASWFAAPLRAFDTSGLLAARAEAMPIADQSVDCVTSIAALEHFLDIDSVLREVYRVLRPGGVFWCHVHLFAGLSGGHTFYSGCYPTRKLPRGEEPWAHLRDPNWNASPVPLNRWRRGQYLNAMANYFSVVKHYTHMTEGQQWLTPKLLESLKDYDEEELLCSSFIMVGVKAKSNSGLI